MQPLLALAHLVDGLGGGGGGGGGWQRLLLLLLLHLQLLAQPLDALRLPPTRLLLSILRKRRRHRFGIVLADDAAALAILGAVLGAATVAGVCVARVAAVAAAAAAALIHEE